MRWVDVVGWCGQAAFFARFLLQWLASEKARRSVTPAAFWWLSMFGAVCLCLYTIDREEPVLLFGIALNGAISARNLFLLRKPDPRTVPLVALLGLSLLGASLLFASDLRELREGWSEAPFWALLVVVGQSAWSARFVVQWWFAERAGHSHLPRAFWWLSLVGNVLLLAYAIHLWDAIYIAGFSVGPFVQVRNLMLLRRRLVPADSHIQ